MTEQCALYMPSTPLNVLVSCAYAVQQKKVAEISSPPSIALAELWLIDQKSVAQNPYFLALLSWEASPFQCIKIFSGSQTGKKKLSERRKNFTQIQKGLDAFSPQQVMVGSDRRVEFQFAMAQLQKKGSPAQGVYLDDGLYSYLGRPSAFLKDGVNALLKKVAYGLWWREPSTVGASSWIAEAWLFSPEHAVPAIQKKVCHRLAPEWFRAPEILQLSQLVAESLAFDTAILAELDVMVLVPHPANVQKISGYAERLKRVVQRFVQQGKQVGIKYHPRSPSDDFLNLKAEGIAGVIPSALAFEFCLPKLATHCQVVGDVGTALFTSKWLRPDLTVYALLDKNDSFQQKFILLSQQLSIKVVNRLEELFE